jgi:hypothetical protein
VHRRRFRYPGGGVDRRAAYPGGLIPLSPLVTIFVLPRLE